MLIVETGEGIPNANSYGTTAQARAYAKAVGLTLPVDDDKLEQQLYRATKVYLETRKGYCGQKTSETQALKYPRKGTYIDCIEVAEDFIPPVLFYAQVHLAAAYEAGYDPQQTLINEQNVIEETVDVLTIKYSAAKERYRPIITVVEDLLSDILCCGGGRSVLTLRRV